MRDISINSDGVREGTVPSGLRVELNKQHDLSVIVTNLGPIDTPSVANDLPQNQLGASYLYPEVDDVDAFLSPESSGDEHEVETVFTKGKVLRTPSPISSVGTTLSDLFHATAATATQGPAKRQRVDARARHWMIVWNNPELGSIDILLSITGLTKYSIQHEVGENGTPHLQGVLSFTSAKKWSTLNNFCDAKCWFQPVKNLQAVKNYCKKQATATGPSWRKGYKAGNPKLVDPLEGKDLYSYQKRIIDIVNGDIHDRLIYWFFSTKGGIGKSALVKHLVMNYGALICGGKKGDMFYAVNKMKQSGNPPDLVVFDIPRSQGATVAYDGIECIKNGCFFSSKYESGACIMNTPHIIIFANMGPVIHMMSNDRWSVTDLDLEIDLRNVGTE